MKTFLKLIICIISVLASHHQVYANEIASITAMRKATKVTIFENRTYKNSDFNNNDMGRPESYLDYMEDLFDLNIGREAVLAKKEIVPWVDISNICKMPEKKKF